MRLLPRRRVRDQGEDRSTCFCDACSTVTTCDTSYRLDQARQDALTLGLFKR